jgi:hypothetical protein
MNRSRQLTGSGMIYRNDHVEVLSSRTVECGILPEDAGISFPAAVGKNTQRGKANVGDMGSKLKATVFHQACPAGSGRSGHIHQERGSLDGRYSRRKFCCLELDRCRLSSMAVS